MYSNQTQEQKDKEQTTFETLKIAITSALVLVLPYDSEPFQIEADSSDYTIDAVLSQQSMKDGKWCLVVFYSKSLSPVEWNYEIYDKEMLAIIYALEE